MTAINHLRDKTGGAVELLESLTDEQLADQIEYMQQQKDNAQTAYATWRYTRAIAQANMVLEHRHD